MIGHGAVTPSRLERQQALRERLRALEQAERDVADARAGCNLAGSVDVVRTGRGALLDVAGHILSLKTALTETERVLSELQVRAEAIRRVVTLIDEVAEETHLLALNAKIIAAQAGQDGAGFGVVATKLMSLAGNTRRATGDVAEILGALADESVRSRDTVHGSVEKIDEGARLADQANDAFDALANLTNRQMRELRRLGARLDALGERRREVEEVAEALLDSSD